MSRNQKHTSKTDSRPETEVKAAIDERARSDQTPAVKSVEPTDLALGLSRPRANDILKSVSINIPDAGIMLAVPSEKELASLDVPALLAKGGEALGCVRLLGRLTLEQVWVAGCYFSHAREKAKANRTWTKDLAEAGYAEATVRQAIHIYEDYPDFQAVRGLKITQAKERSGRVSPKGSKARQSQRPRQGEQGKQAGTSQQGAIEPSPQGTVQMTGEETGADDNTGPTKEPPPPPDWSRPVEDFTPPPPEIELPDPLATEVEWLRQAALYLAWLAADMNPLPKYQDTHKTFLRVVEAWRNARPVSARSPRADARRAS